jgi:alpha-ketoglutarate-dependent taurine dioxygenase
MVILNTINFTSIEDVSKNIEVYKKLFVENGILAFRDANLSHEDHLKIHDVFGKGFGSWQENTDTGYTENHSRSYNLNSQTDKIMLPWHIEHPTYDNPIVLGTWNMHNFKTSSKNGKTYFVNSRKLYAQMPDEFKEFLKKCKIYDAESPEQGTHDVVGYHWLTGDPVIRTSFVYESFDSDSATAHNQQKLYTVEDKAPSLEDLENYFQAIKWIEHQLYSNLEIRIVHEWKQGDLVVPDIHLMYHAVTGGFDPSEREFVGIWGRKNRDSRWTI